MLDTKRLADTLVSGAKAYIDKALAGVQARVDALEKRQPEKGEPGRDGLPGERGPSGVGVAGALIDKNGSLVVTLSDGRVQELGIVVGRDGRDGVDGERGAAGAAGRDGENGKDGADGVDGKDGRDGVDGKDGEPGRDGVDGKDGRDGVDGKDAPPPTQEQVVDAILSMPDMIDAAVQKYLASNPPPAGKDGAPGRDGKDGISGKDGADGRNGSDGKDGADGVGLAAAVQDAEGNLIITDTKGGIHNVGRVRGVDGQNGERGADGKDGRDGFSLSDFDAELMEDGRTILLSFERGDQEFKVELGIPALIYRGVWKDGQQYERGDVVTFGGGMFHCNEDTGDKPETSKAWTLAVKRGRDGKDGAPGERGERGAEGKPGRDLTQLGPDGAKW